MRKIVFLASATAQKPIILMKSFFETINIEPSENILLTNNQTGTVVEYAKKNGMGVIVSEDSEFKDCNWLDEHLGQYKEFILVSCGWPYKIPIYLIESFFAALNCHGSYLPDYRGSRAYMHYWANCSEYFGATIHYLNEKFDDGNILIRGKERMFPDESHDVIFVRTAELCGHLLPAAILMAENKDVGFKPIGIKRYFFQRSPQEFENHREMNESLISIGKKPVLTPHKILE
jgi:folate-dependent phosphoribosylglycinamide formyltransferase PurN